MFCSKLMVLRKKAKLSKADMSKKLELKYTTYDNYERGTAEPKLSTLVKIADTFNVSLDDLLERFPDNENERLQKLISELLSKFDMQDTIKLDKGIFNGILSGLSEEILFKINEDTCISIPKKIFISKSNSIDSSMKSLGKKLMFYYLVTSLMNKREQDIKKELDKNNQIKSSDIDNLYRMIAISNDQTMNTLYQVQKDIPNVLEQKFKEIITDLTSKDSE